MRLRSITEKIIVAKMQSHPQKHSWWWRGLAFAGFWTLIGLSFASQFYISSAKFGASVSWLQAVSWALGDWYVWAALSAPIIWLARRFHFDRSNWLPTAGIHLLAGIAFSFVYIFLRAWVGQWQSSIAGHPVRFSETFAPLIFKTLHFNFMVYWVILSIVHAFDYYRKFQEREIRASELEKRLVQARLQTLQMQLNPHFLFNTLNAISTLVHKNPDAADRMIVRLSDLLRYTLESSNAQEVTLKQELSFLEQYLDIVQTRFGDRLQVKQDIEPAVLDAKIPNLLLQPLVENAVRHGIEPKAGKGIIQISARRQHEQLELEVRDNGAGLSANPREGVGLSNTRARLEQLYPHAHGFHLRNGAEGGLIVTVQIPFLITA